MRHVKYTMPLRMRGELFSPHNPLIFCPERNQDRFIIAKKFNQNREHSKLWRILNTHYVAYECKGCKIIVLELKIEEKKFRKAKMEAIEITNRVPLSNQFSS